VEYVTSATARASVGDPKPKARTNVEGAKQASNKGGTTRDDDWRGMELPLIALLINQTEEDCWLICCERKTLFLH
jgi:hypothetical protein